MPIHVACPRCGTVLAAPDNAGGQMVACPSCQGMMTLPSHAGSGTDPSSGTRRDGRTASSDRGDGDRPWRDRSWEEQNELPASPPRRLKTYPPVSASFVVGGLSLILNIGIVVGIYAAIVASALWSTKPRPPIRKSATPENRLNRPDTGIRLPGDGGKSAEGGKKLSR